MAIRNLRFKGDEILAKKAKQIEEIDDRVKELAYDMLDTLYENDGVGIAACQVGVLKALVVIDVSYIDEKNPKKDPIFLINPIITSYSKSTVLVEEGCLSYPNLFVNIQRHEKVNYEYTDLDGKRQVRHAKGMEAICVQHELDHLNGVIFLERKES